MSADKFIHFKNQNIRKDSILALWNEGTAIGFILANSDSNPFRITYESADEAMKDFEFIQKELED